MKKLVLTSLIALAASQSAGCIIESGDDTEDARISATWEIRSEASNTTASCPPGFTTAALYNQPVDANGNNNGAVIIDLFDCADRAGTSAPLYPQMYLTWIEIANDNNTSVYAQSLSAYVDVTVSDKTFNTQILTDGGYFQVAWDLVGASSNASLSCATAGATDGVEMVGTDVVSPSNSNSDIFDCEDGSGITAGYLQGRYTIAVQALGPNENPIGPAATLTNKDILPANQVTNLGTVQVPVTGK
jgi:hypothetical protein